MRLCYNNNFAIALNGTSRLKKLNEFFLKKHYFAYFCSKQNEDNEILSFESIGSGSSIVKATAQDSEHNVFMKF